MMMQMQSSIQKRPPSMRQAAMCCIMTRLNQPSHRGPKLDLSQRLDLVKVLEDI